MVAIREKLVVTNRLSARCPTHSLTEVSVRDIGTLIDEPAERGGTNRAPSPTETLMAALVGCVSVISHKCAKKHGVTFQAMSIDAEWTLDRRGTQLVEEVEVPFPEVRVTIHVTTDASDADMEKVKADLARFCPVSKVVAHSGTKLTKVWDVQRP